MLEHAYPPDRAQRQDVLVKRNGLGKNSLHLICVAVMQLLQLAQGLVTDADLNSNVTLIAASPRSLLLEGETSIMAAVRNAELHSTYSLREMVTPSAVVSSSKEFQIVDSLLLPIVSCTPFISCDVVDPTSSSCCQNLTKISNVAQIDLTDTLGMIPSENSKAMLRKKKKTPPSLVYSIKARDDRCDGQDVFLYPNASKAKISFRRKREAEAAQKSLITARNRFRRPTTARTTTTEQEEEPEEVTQSPFQRRKLGNLHTTSNKPTVTSKKRLIKPSRASTVPSSRAKFTLREETTTQKTSTSSRRAPFRRPQLSSNGIGNKRVTTSSKINSSNGSNRRGSTHEESYTRSTLSNRGRSSTPSGRSRSGSLRDSDTRGRHRGSQDYDSEPLTDLNDGTITVTHVTPSETQIPMVNGQVTEYKQIVVAKTSTEVLGPHQFTKSFAPNGQTVLVLTSQATSINHAGATEVTQYVLHETPTTSVTFTPTTIRGRRTSFSYVLPSTAYSVENVVSTIQPQISADAPLANILLSQLLLGNVGFPSNPLFGAGDNNLNLNGNANANIGPATPTTEFRTHTSTYVTTLFEGTSTVLPITFQGKRITTTIYDTTPKVITATEFVTDTIVLPGVAQSQAHAQSPINNLLLQQLLLQQVQQKQETAPQVPQITPTAQQPFAIENTKLPDYETENNIRDSAHHTLLPSGDSFTRDDIEEVTTVKPRRNGKKHRKRNKEESKSDETSVITLYVSGKFPGEFSTVLSTVHVQPDSTRAKRYATADYNADDLDDVTHDDIDVDQETASDGGEATQSLTDILGKNHKWHVDLKPTRVY